jgi:aminoglycoside phosphotransferase (APT) family kinase protein
MADWNFYLAYNLFRIAAITQGIAKRVRSTARRPARRRGPRRGHACAGRTRLGLCVQA